MNDTYFVTGGNGFIGSQLVRKLVQEGHSLRLWLRETAQSPVDDKRVTVFRGTLKDRAEMKATMKGCVGVFHLAAMARIIESYPGETFDINVEGSRSVFMAAKAAGIERLVCTSTAGVFGPSKEKRVDERQPLPERYFLNYERSKAMLWALTDDFVSDGLDIVTVHPTRVFGPGPLSESNSVTLLIKQFIEGKWRYMPGKGDRIGNYAYVDDVVNGHLLAMHHGVKGAHYILGGNDITYTQLAERTMAVAGVDYGLKHVPFALMMALAQYYSVRYQWFGISPKFLPGHVRKYMCDWSVSSDKAVREIDYAITPFDAALEKTVCWIKNEHPIP